MASHCCHFLVHTYSTAGHSLLLLPSDPEDWDHWISSLYVQCQFDPSSNDGSSILFHRVCQTWTGPRLEQRGGTLVVNEMPVCIQNSKAQEDGVSIGLKTHVPTGVGVVAVVVAAEMEVVVFWCGRAWQS